MKQSINGENWLNLSYMSKKKRLATLLSDKSKSGKDE